jgi:hypothetical protein
MICPPAVSHFADAEGAKPKAAKVIAEAIPTVNTPGTATQYAIRISRLLTSA